MIVSLHITHTSAGGMESLDTVITAAKDAVTATVAGDPRVDEYVVVATCNRLEAYVATRDNHGVRIALEDAVRRSIPYEDREYWYVLQDRDSIRHLFTVVCGIDSLIVGEDQIQHQVKRAFEDSREEGHVGKILYTLFNNAIIVGKRVRTETDLNKGAVSVGYAAIELAERRIGDLHGKDIAIFGAGEMASLIAKNLSGKGPEAVFVTNRTFERAQELAKELGGNAVTMDRMEEMISKSDLVLVATSARSPIVKKEGVARAMSARPDRPLLIIDVSVPLNTEEDVVEIPNVSLSTMASLDAIAAENVARRKKEISNAKRIIDQELRKVEEIQKTRDANAVIKGVSIMCETVRREEAEIAKAALRSTDPDKVIDDMSRSVVKMISADLIKRLRMAALNGEDDVVEAAAKLFGIELE